MLRYFPKTVFLFFLFNYGNYNVLFESSGFARLGLMSVNKVVGIMMIVLGCLWSLISLAAVFLTIRVYGCDCLNKKINCSIVPDNAIDIDYRGHMIILYFYSLGSSSVSTIRR
jgi:hypothetical protein